MTTSELTEKIISMLYVKYISFLSMPSADGDLRKVLKPRDIYCPNSDDLIMWNIWKEKNGITTSPSSFVDYVKILWMGASPLYVPKDFVDKAIVLNFLP